jgi:voltage-gated potassium channel
VPVLVGASASPRPSPPVKGDRLLKMRHMARLGFGRIGERHVPQDVTTLRRRLSQLFDDELPRSRETQIFNSVLAVLIVINVAAVVLETVEPIRNRYVATFEWMEHAATAIFAVEYLLRAWTAVDLSNARFSHPFWGRLRYLRGFFPLIDLVSVLPGVLGLLGAGDLRVLRLLRLLRMLKLTRHSKVFGLLWAVFRAEAHSIGALLFILCLTLTISGALAYMVEGDEQPAVFSSIPVSMWWAIETLTTVGYGDMVPVTAIGKILGGIVSIVGIGTLALFSGVITIGFLDQIKSYREQDIDGNGLSGGAGSIAPVAASNFFQNVCPHCGGTVDINDRADRMVAKRG